MKRGAMPTGPKAGSSANVTKSSATPSRNSNLRHVILAAVLLFVVLYLLFGSASKAKDGPPTDQRSAQHSESVQHSNAQVKARYTPDACTYVNFTTAKLKNHFGKVLHQLLSYGPRVGGSSSRGYYGVMEALVDMMQCGPGVPGGVPVWKVSYDNFTDTTPIGSMQFTNLISTIENPYFVNGDGMPLDRRTRRRFPSDKGRSRLDHLVIAAHWDSKLMHDQQPFLGACDSASPMVIALELMKLISGILAEARSGGVHAAIARNRLPKKVTVIFFDGEEAFVEWKDNDHTYGSRHLAQRWSESGEIESIDLFVLLDLIGVKDSVFHNYFPRDSGAFHDALHDAERRLVDQRKRLSGRDIFPREPKGFPHKVDDDHIHWLPFVPVLHVIPLPFPKVWHTVADDESAIDVNTMVDHYRILAHGLLGVSLAL